MANDRFLIWWTNQSDCERIAPLDSWPTWLYDEFRSRLGRHGRGRLWVPGLWDKDAPGGVSVEWDTGNNWLCRAADDAGGIVIPADALRHVQFMPGFVTTFDMALPENITDQ
jgi:hypothetical protein